MNEVADLQYSVEFFATVEKRQDEYLDFGEDYEQIRHFFMSEQRAIFDKSLDLINIFEDSKSFVSDKEIYEAFHAVKAIVTRPAPYGEIYKLPDLNQKFWNLYIKLLEDLTVPVQNTVGEARKRVLNELEGKKCHDLFYDRYTKRFQEIKDKAERCNNVADLQNIKLEVDALKVRMLQEIADKEHEIFEEEAKKAAKAKWGYPNAVTPPVNPQPKLKKRKTVSIRTISTEASWQIENKDDIDRYISELKKNLEKQLEDDTVINIEF